MFLLTTFEERREDYRYIL